MLVKQHATCTKFCQCQHFFQMDFVPPEVKDVAILRRALFASVYLPRDCPNYWNIVTQFAKGNSNDNITPSMMKVTIDL